MSGVAANRMVAGVYFDFTLEFGLVRDYGILDFVYTRSYVGT